MIITSAVIGSIDTPSMSPHLPVLAQEIADAAIGAAEAGAAIVHLHARDPKTGKPKHSPWAFLPFLRVIKQRSEVVVNITARGAQTMRVGERVLPAQRFSPEIASLHSVDRRVIEPPLFIQSVFGILGGIGTHPEDVAHMKRTADRLFGDSHRWSVLGAGKAQFAIATQALLLGGNVRVGLEDSLWLGPVGLARSSAEQVTRIRQINEALVFATATPAEAREMLALKGGDAVNF